LAVPQQHQRRPFGPPPFVEGLNKGNAQMAETIAQNQVLAAKRWMEDEAGMERASLSPAEYVAYRMKVSPADADALVAAVYALEEDE
jgi:hypothetical protein